MPTRDSEVEGSLMRVKRFSTGLRATLLAIFTVTVFVTGTLAATEKVHNFQSNFRDGFNPDAGLIFDGSGNLYGTTSSGGSDGYGAVFELTPKAGGGWTEKLLHSFIVNGKNDGNSPVSGLVLDSSGNLYGTTQYGGTYYVGTVFELTPKAGGGWTEKIVHNFDSNNHKDGYSPVAGLIIDATGNLFGTTYSGGTYGYGTVFEIKP
jgi:uncharacterized repeat protein (TIGR03803 family)